MAALHAVKKQPVTTAPRASFSFFDLHPVELDGFRFTGRAAVPLGVPTVAQWEAAVGFAAGCEVSSPFWVGDLLAFGTTRADWREKFDRLMEETGLSRHTLHSLTSISRRVKEPARAIAPSFSHTRAVTRLQDEQQEYWLDRARTEGWTETELRREIRHAARTTVVAGQHPACYDVLVTVKLTVEALTPFGAEDKARGLVKEALKGFLSQARVISAHAPGRE